MKQHIWIVLRKEGCRMKQILFIDCCVRKNSRTRRLAEAVLSRLEGTVTLRRPYAEELPAVDESVIEKRHDASLSGDFSDGLFAPAREFAGADEIVIAAPYWDMSFPACLKRYIETVSVSGVTFSYTDDGRPRGLCRAGRFYYITTAGGEIGRFHLGYEYIHAVMENLVGVREGVSICAERMDVIGEDPEQHLREALRAWERSRGAG